MDVRWTLFWRVPAGCGRKSKMSSRWSNLLASLPGMMHKFTFFYTHTMLYTYKIILQLRTLATNFLSRIILQRRWVVILSITKTNVCGNQEEISHGPTPTGEHIKATLDLMHTLVTIFTTLAVVCVFLWILSLMKVINTPIDPNLLADPDYYASSRKRIFIQIWNEYKMRF